MKSQISNFYYLCVLCALSASSVSYGRELLVHGTQEMYWIARVTRSEAGDVRTIIQSRGIGGQAAWKRIAQPGGTVVSMASRGNELAVLLDNGDWMLVWDGGSSGGALPEDGARLIELFSGGETLWAIGSAGQGRKPTTRAATHPAATLPVGTRSLYQLDRGQWVHVATLPPETAEAADLALAGDQPPHEPAPLLAALLDGGQVRLFTLETDSASWTSAGALAADPGATRIKFLSDLGRTTLWAGDEKNAGAIFSRQPEWSAAIPLSMPQQASGTVESDITVAGKSIRLVLLRQGADKLLEASFGPDGSERGPPVELPLPRPGTGEARPMEWLSVIAAALLVMVLLNSLRAPRPLIDPEKLEESGIVLAPYGRRFAAAAIDLLPLIASFAFAWLSLAAEERDNPDAFFAAWKWPRYVATAVYVLHTMLTEVLWGWTIGKKLLGLRVTLLDGAAPSRGAMCWRNILRVVDVAMLFPALLVFITPLRQRVGDVAAETIVVVGSAARPSEASEDKDEADTKTSGQGDEGDG